MEPIGGSFYTVCVSFDTLSILFDRFGSGSYNPYVVLAELLLIGLMVNWCAGVLHGTRGTRLLRGLLVVLVVATLVIRVLADQMHWTRLALLYQYFIIGMAFVALVAFQPELRRALIRAGDVRFLRRKQPAEKVIAALVEAAGYLSRNKYGALIAIQRDVGLANWAENGTPLNAEVSANLLKTIFYPNSALHDLGVIIRGNRIVAAGCQFPVAESGDVDPGLGSRHRAAVGLSAESDALVLVVSEETGTISLAEAGKLTRYLALDDLEEELESRLAGGLFIPRRRRARTLSDLWRIVRRLLVVVPMTLVIWFLADQASLVPAEGVELTLNIAHGESLVVDSERPPVFRLAIRGPRREIDTLRTLASEHRLKATWDLPAALIQPGNRVTLKEEQLREIIAGLPEFRKRGIYVDSVTPEQFSFTPHRVVPVELPVHVEAGSLRVAVARIVPDHVMVQIRAKDLQSIPSSERFVAADLTERLASAIPGRDLSFRAVPLRPEVGRMPTLAIDPPIVDVDLRVVGETARRRIGGVRVQLAVSPQIWQRFDLDIYDANEWLLELEVEGEKSAVESLQASDVRAFVPLAGDQIAVTEDYRSMKVEIEFPPGVTLVGPPREVRFRLRPREGVTP